MRADSSSHMRVAALSSSDRNAASKNLYIVALELYATRLARKFVAIQFEGSDFVVENEERLIRSAANSAREALSGTTFGYCSWGQIKVQVMRRVRHFAAVSLSTQDYDMDVKVAALDAVQAADMSELFPSSWTDS